MNDHRTEKTGIPSWMCQEEDYMPSGDKEAFLTKSTKSVLSVLSKLRFNEGKDGRFSAAPSLKLFYTILFIILTASSKNYLFVLIMCAAVTVRLAFFSAAAIRQILSGTAGADLDFSSFAGSIYGKSTDYGEYYCAGVCFSDTCWHPFSRDIVE